MRGTPNSWGATQLYVDSDKDDLGFITNVELARNGKLRFTLGADDWSQACGWGQLQSSSEAYACFADASDDNNIQCRVAGTYNFYINKEGKIYATFATEATYSYVLTDNTAYTNNYIYDSSDSNYEIAPWASAPAHKGRAYDIKVTISEVDYWGLYRIDDRLLKTFDRLILKEAGGAEGLMQTGNISKTKGNTQMAFIGRWNNKVWNNTSHASTTDEYKALDFLYDLVNHRGAATYNEYNFAYSICHTDVDTARALVQKYDGFADSTRTYLQKASCETYDVSGELSEYTKKYQNVADMVDALRIIVARADAQNNDAKLLNFFDSKTNTTITIVVISSIALVSILGAGLMIKRRKEDR